MIIYGYARVSSKSQENNSSLEGQKLQLIENGILEKHILFEIGSAGTEIKNRPIFQTLINQKLQEGDTLMVTKIDRCSRNTLEFLKLQDILFKRKIEFISLDLPHSDDPSINRLIATTLSSTAEFEYNRRKKRQAAGIRAAKKKGKYQGRKTIILKTLASNAKDKTKKVIVVIILGAAMYFSNVKPAGAKNNWRVEGFTAPISRPGQSSRGYFDSRPAKGASGQNPVVDGSGGNQNPSSGSDAASCSSNPTPKAAPEVMNYGLGSQPKTKKQKALEKMKRELKESIQEEDKINAQRKKQGKASITLIIKDGIRFFAPNDQLRDKYHHAPDLDSPIPGTLVDGELARLADPSLYRERLETLRNKEVLPDAYVEQYGRDLRLHVLDPDTKIIEGTLGANREVNGGPPKIEGYHFYNDRTGFNGFFDKNGRRYRTGFETNRSQKIDIKTNSNMM